jgi:hypothetical protein
MNPLRMSKCQQVLVAKRLMKYGKSEGVDQRRDQQLPVQTRRRGCSFLVDGRCANTPRPVRTPDRTRSRT